MSMEALPAEYRREPALALAGGEDGLDAVRVLVKEAPRFLDHGGHLVVEIGHNRGAAETAFPRLPMTWLSTETSDDGVFIVTREELVNGR
jgi:ribosomal protein L3 glutamine methyltransferase